MEIIKSNRQNDKICLDGHMYTLYYETSQTIKWQCSKKSSLKFAAVLSTDKQIIEYEKNHRHNHLPNRKEVMVTKALMNMKEKSCKYIYKYHIILYYIIVLFTMNTRRSSK